MAKIKLSPVLEEMHGMVGRIVYRMKQGRQTASKAPRRRRGEGEMESEPVDTWDKKHLHSHLRILYDMLVFSVIIGLGTLENMSKGYYNIPQTITGEINA